MCVTMTVTLTATAKDAVNQSHTKLSFLYNGVQFVANSLLIVYCSPVPAPPRRARSGEWFAMAPFFLLVIIIPLNSWPRHQLLPFSVRIPPRSRFLVLGRHRSLLRSCSSEKTPTTTVAVNVALAAIVTSTFTSHQGHVTKRVV